MLINDLGNVASVQHYIYTCVKQEVMYELCYVTVMGTKRITQGSVLASVSQKCLTLIVDFSL